MGYLSDICFAFTGDAGWTQQENRFILFKSSTLFNMIAGLWLLSLCICPITKLHFMSVVETVQSVHCICARLQTSPIPRSGKLINLPLPFYEYFIVDVIVMMCSKVH